MTRLVIVCALALCISATAVWAQFPNSPGGSGDMTITKNGLFVLKNGVLAKFDATTLKQQGTALELFGPPPEPPTPGTVTTEQDRQKTMNWSYANGIRSCPAAMQAKDDELLIVMYNSVFRVNQRTMTLDTTQSKLLVDDPQNPNVTAPWMVRNLGKPVLQLNGNVLFVLLGTNLIAVNADTGRYPQQWCAAERNDSQNPHHAAGDDSSPHCAGGAAKSHHAAADRRAEPVNHLQQGQLSGQAGELLMCVTALRAETAGETFSGGLNVLTCALNL